MPPKTASRKAINNENDENAATTRVTRAKAAALGASDTDIVKRTLQRSKSTTSGTAAATLGRRRAALGDVSNVGKNDAGADGNLKDEKKPLASKNGFVSKAAQPTRVQKLSRANSTRSILGNKEKNSTSELKRSASGSGVTGHVSKKRHTSSTSSSSSKVVVEEELEDAETKVASTTTKVTVEVEKTVQIQNVTSVDVEVPAPAGQEAGLELPAGVLDLDADDVDDPLMVSEYVGEIFDYLRDLELNTMPNTNYMDNQPDLDWNMRGILVDWLLEVHARFRLLPETLFLAVNIIDRFLTCKVVQLDRLQLVGVTAMFIASKYEEVLSPHVSNFRHVADDGFSEEEILSAERFVLLALNYDLSYPNPMNFLRRISKADNYDVQTRTVGKYLLEISCLDRRFIEHPPSQIAAAAMYLARLVLERGEWDATLSHYAGYTKEELEPCFLLMMDYLYGPVKHEAFFKKYAHKKFLKASMVVRQWVKGNAPQHFASLSRDHDLYWPLNKSR